MVPGRTRRWSLLLGTLVLAGLASTASAQGPAPVVPAAPVAGATAPAQLVYVRLTTSAGAITLELDKAHAPLTVANFLKYVDAKRMDGAVFYRAMHLDGDHQGLLQGGVRDGAKLLPPVAHEPTSKTGILHKAGTISMARFAPGSATADFLILLSDMPSLDAEPGNSGTDPGAGFAAFGHVVDGMETVHAIWGMPRSATKGEGVMKGEILENEVKIVAARRIAPPPPPTPQAAPSPAPAPATL